MTVLSEKQAERLKKIVLKYVRDGGALPVLQVSLKSECEAASLNATTLYRSIPINTETQDDYIDAILGCFQIEKGTKIHQALIAESENLAGLLKNLDLQGHAGISRIRTEIANTTFHRNWAPLYLVAGFVSTLLGAISYFQKKQLSTLFEKASALLPAVFGWLTKTFSFAKNIPLLGIGYTTLDLSFIWLKTFRNTTLSTARKISAVLFNTVAGLLNIGAYVFSYLAQGALSFPAATLFVFSSSIDIVKSTFTFYKHHKTFKQLTTPTEESTWHECARYERIKNTYHRALSSIGVKVAAGLLVTIAVALWSFSPPNLIITIASLSFITLMGLARQSMLKTTHNHYDNQLQNSLHHIIPSPEDKLFPSALHQRKHEEIAQQKLALCQKEKELSEREQAVVKAFSQLGNAANDEPSQPLDEMDPDETSSFSSLTP